jgi:hypothetical protein
VNHVGKAEPFRTSSGKAAKRSDCDEASLSMPTKNYAAKSLIQTLFIALLLSTAYGQSHGPRRIPLDGAPTTARSSQTSTPQSPPAEATVTLGEQFFNAFLEAIYRNLKPPSAPLAITASDKDRTDSSSEKCPDVIVLERENSGVKTAVKFEQGRIAMPLAFSGSYNSTLMGCIEFSGWADTRLNLEFDKARQTLTARAQVLDVHLNNVPSLANAPLAKIVQSAIDKKINPIEILRLEQLSARVPVAASGGALRLRAKEVTPEIVPGVLRLHIAYEFVADR